MLHTALYACMWLLSHLRGFTSRLPRTMRQTRNQLRSGTYLHSTCETLHPSRCEIRMCHFTWKGGKTYRFCFFSPNCSGGKGCRWGQKPAALDSFALSRMKLFGHTHFTFPSERSGLRPSLVRGTLPATHPSEARPATAALIFGH